MTVELGEIPHWDVLVTSRYCLGDWKRILQKNYAAVQPLLVKCVGEIAKTFPHPDTGLRLRVRQLEQGYVAHPMGGFEYDSEDLLLTEKDVQLWRVDQKTADCRLKTADRGRGAGKTGEHTHEPIRDTPVKGEAAEQKPGMLTIRQAAEYARLTSRTIYNLLRKINGDGSPLLGGVIGEGRLTRIPRTSLDPYRNPVKVTRKKTGTPPKRTARKAVKRKS